jgi:hypothetical protein
MPIAQMTPLENAEDRGGADSYYRRGRNPHIRVGPVDIPLTEGTPEWRAYMAGYDENEKLQNFKDWGHD